MYPEKKVIRYSMDEIDNNTQRWQKKDYTGPCVWYVYLNQVLTNTVRTDGTEEDVARLMTNNHKQYDTIYRGPDAV
jgi:hypothetical protein